MSREKQVLQQVINDRYRSPMEKEAAQARLDQINGVVRSGERLTNSEELVARLNKRIQDLTGTIEDLIVRVQLLEAGLVIPADSPGTPENVTPEQTPHVEPTPQETKSGGRGRPKGRYEVEGERGNWGIKDRETGMFVHPVQKKRTYADAICRQYNKGELTPQVGDFRVKFSFTDAVPPSERTGGAGQTAEPIAPESEPEPVVMYRPEDEKPAPEVRPDREQAAGSATGRVPWYAK